MTEKDLLSTIEAIEAQEGPFAPELIAPLLELGRLYATTERCANALPLLQHAIEVSRHIEGLFDPRQLELLDPLIDCTIALDRQADLERGLQRVVLLNETTYGKKNPRIVPGLTRVAQWYEEAGRYLTARQLYSRAIGLVRKAGGKEDLRLVEPLRGIAQSFHLEYVHGLHDVDAAQAYGSPYRSKAEFSSTRRQLDDLGLRSLQQAVEILRAHPETNRTQFIDTLLELGDWYQMADARKQALRIYNEIFQMQNSAFEKPEAILYRPQVGVALRRTPPPEQKRDLAHYHIDLTYTVTREGRVTDVVVTESNAPKHLQYRLVESLEKTRYRPRFLNGEPVDTPNLHHRQGVYVGK